MKVLIITASNPNRNAGIVSKDLYTALKKCGVDTRMLVGKWDRYHNNDIVSTESFLKHLQKKISSKLLGVIRRATNHKKQTLTVNRDYAFLDYDQTVTHYDTKKLLSKIRFKPDRIIVLFMQGFLSYRNLKELYTATGAPIYIYLMDMAAITGGCHYAWNCTGYLEKCGFCPALGSITEIDQSRVNWTFKYDNTKDIDITLIAPTEWTYTQVTNSSMFRNKKKEKILISVDETIFKHYHAVEAKKFFNLPPSKKIIFIGAVSISNRRKGFKELLEALNTFKAQSKGLEIHLLIAGHADEQFIKSLPFECTTLGSIDYNKLALAFCAADVFVSASIEDSGPMMINQSIMSGTPVVSFSMGVAFDLVMHLKTGYRAKLKDTQDLANGIQTILSLDENSYLKMREECRQLGKAKLSHEAQGRAFLELLTKH